MDRSEEVISVVCPTRNRPDNVRKLVASARSRADHPEQLQLVFYVDDDDQTFPLTAGEDISIVRGPRFTLSLMYNVCLPAVRGDIIMYAGDDLEFISQGWDTAVRKCFDSFPDRLILVHGDDMGQDPRKVATHGFLHRRWVETVGYLVPPFFPAGWADSWLTEVADRVGRRWFLPDLLIEHQHPLWGKGSLDQTHEERLERLRSDHGGSRFSRLRRERRQDAKKLRSKMDERTLPAITRLGVPSWWLQRVRLSIRRPRWLR